MPKKIKQIAKGARGKKIRKGTEKRQCRRCGNSRGLIHRYGLRICRRCFREVAEAIGFHKYGG
jgi:ribosomal protein S14